MEVLQTAHDERAHLGRRDIRVGHDWGDRYMRRAGSRLYLRQARIRRYDWRTRRL